MVGNCHRKGRQLPEEGSPIARKPQKSSPLGSGVLFSAAPTAWPQTLAPNATLLAPPSPGLPMSSFSLLNQRTACTTPLGVAAAPAANPLLVTKYAWPGGSPTLPRSVTV